MTSDNFVEPVLQSIAKAERHMKSEYGSRMVGVMDTIGRHPHFAMMLEPGIVKVFSGRGDIDAMYRGSVTYAEPQASRLLSQLTTDWYMFIENVPTRLWISDGSLRTVQTITMLVTDDEQGLSGEYAWQRYYPEAREPDDGSIAMPEQALHNLKLHDDLLAAMTSGDTATLTSLLDPDCIWAQRNALSVVAGGELLDTRGAAGVADYLAKWHGALQPLHVSILNRKVTDWFVFAEELWVVRPYGGELRQYRAANIYPISQTGRIEGALGFGRELAALSPSAGAKLGLAFWPLSQAALPASG